MQDLKGKRIIIGGGATGIGAGLALKLLDLGANVLVGDINGPGLDKLSPELEGKPGRAITMVFDLSDHASIERLVQRCIDEFGGIDGLAIPGADLSKETLGRDDGLLDLIPEVWERSFRVNTLGHAMLMKAAIPHMIEGGGGAVAVVSSEASYRGTDYVPAYSATKAGLQAVVRHVARLFGKDGIRANGICPGRIINDRSDSVVRNEVVDKPPVNALRRHGNPGDIAGVLAFLLSDESRWITGQIISANGGADMRD